MVFHHVAYCFRRNACLISSDWGYVELRGTQIKSNFQNQLFLHTGVRPQNVRTWVRSYPAAIRVYNWYTHMEKLSSFYSWDWNNVTMFHAYSFHGLVITFNVLGKTVYKGWLRVGAWTGTLKNSMKCLWRWEPDHRFNFFFNPPAYLCTVTYITEISLHVTLNNQSQSLIHSTAKSLKFTEKLNLSF